MSSLIGKGFVISAMALALAGALAMPARAQDKPIVLKIHNFQVPTAAVNVRVLQPFAKQMAEQSKGRLKIEVYPAMQLGGKSEELYGQARSGVVDGIWVVTGFTPGKFPLTEVFALPFVSGNGKATSAAVMEMWTSTDWLKKEFSETTPLVFHVASTDALHTKKAVTSIADLKGLKLRAADRVIAASLKEFGVSVVGMTLPDAVTALQRGILDGTSSSWFMGKTVKFCDMTDNHTDLPGFSKVVFVLTLNTDSFKKLPPDLQKMIRNYMTVERAKQYGAWWDEDDEEGTKYCAKSGKIHKLPPDQMAEWKKRLQPIIDDWVARTSKEQNVDAAKIVADARRLVAKHAN